MMKYFCDPFGKLFNFPPHTLSIAEAAPIKKSVDIDSSKEESKRQPLTEVGPENGPISVSEECPAIEVAAENSIDISATKKNTAKKKNKVKAKSLVTRKEEDKKMVKHKEECHDEHEKCCYFPEVPVVLKAFEWCDYKYHYEAIEKFEEYIKEYYCKYPCILIHYTKVYPSECKLRFCVFFNLCEYEKAFEIEAKLQKIYREYKLHGYGYKEVI